MEKPPQTFKEQVASIMREHLDKLELSDLKAISGDRRVLSRKEKQFLESLKITNPIDIHDTLGSSAYESDDTIYQFRKRTAEPSEFNEHYIRALKQVNPPSKISRVRKDQEVVDINGKKVRWGEFKRKFLEDV